jgi:para-nitrobenzyl esterase
VSRRRPRARAAHVAAFAAFVAFAALAALAAAASGCLDSRRPGDDDAGASDPPGPLNPVLTDDGPVHGRADAVLGIHSYRGLPYAAPPVGDLRFADPEPPAPWTAVRDATKLGYFCPQLDSAWGTAPAAARQSEDCLTLNVWTPASSPDEHLPVLVYLHGGSFVVGGAGFAAYDGAKLASSGHVVVVTLNYRLGPLGFWAHAELSAASPHASSGNYGILDQIQALRWIQANVAHFGGDPERVTLFGHSSGGASVCTLYASPLARGLFAGAIIQSGFCSSSTETLAEMEALGDEAAAALDCDTADDVPACLRAAPVADVLAALAPGVQLEDGVHYRPIVDDYVLPAPSGDLLAEGDAAHLPLVNGTAADEGSIYARALALTTVDAYEAWVADRWPDDVDALLALYPAATDDEVLPELSRLITHWLYTCPARRIATDASSYAPVWRYQFEHVSWDAARRGVGAYHGAELPYVFHYFKDDASHMWSADDAALSAALIADWSRFAATGDASPWPAYDPGVDPYEVLDWPRSAGDDLESEACDTWDAI